MTQAAHKNRETPIWARDDAFPPAPAGWGWADAKRNNHPCESAEALITAIRDDLKADVTLAWTPAHRYMILPEEVVGSTEAVLAARKRRANDDYLDSQEKLRWYGGLLAVLTAYMLFRGWSTAPGIAVPVERFGFAFRTMLSSMSIGIALLMFLILAFIPWYQSRKRVRELKVWSLGDIAALIPPLRFETWLDHQKAPATWLFLGLLGLVGAAQLMPGDSISAAGLVKERYFNGEWWRLFTAPLLHGNIVHFLMNAAALAYLGKRLEVFAGWPHLALVFLFSASIGGEASARFVLSTSVGASGGLMGWLGFLLVFESLHCNLVPRSSRRRLLAGVLLTGLIGLIGYRFVDNAAHIGGLAAGMLYATIVFPKSSSAIRPQPTLTDRIAGIAALVVLILAVFLTVWKILQP